MNDGTERWLPVDDIPAYEVSDHGRVRGVDRFIHRKDGRVRLLRGKVLAQWRNRKGYACVTLSRSGKRSARYVHQLVMLAFVGPCPEGMEVRHGPAGKQDNGLANLCYGTPAENQADRLRDGTHLQGPQLPQAKLTEEIVRECRIRFASGNANFPMLAKEFGVSRATMRNAINGKTWKHVA